MRWIQAEPEVPGGNWLLGPWAVANPPLTTVRVVRSRILVVRAKGGKERGMAQEVAFWAAGLEGNRVIHHVTVSGHGRAFPSPEEGGWVYTV
jgi:hypothetical protein